DSGLLVHCISGWDRTPLFVSLLRLSLWADGAVHASLGPAEILYLTIAYDWFLFGSQYYTPWYLLVLLFPGSRDRGSITSLSSDFSLITEEVAGASCPNADTMDLFSNQPQASNWLAAEYSRSGSSLSTEYGSWQIVSGCGSIHDHGHFSQPMASVSSNSSAVTSAYDSPLPFSFQDEGPSGRMCSLPSERQARLEAVREIFLAAYSSTVGLRSSVPSPSGAISGLLEQFARGVGLRGSNAIV
ncbi:hypothetical protein GOODEAATRI_014506, partial [Goodea atripinnis]